MDRKLLRQRLRLAYGLSALEARSIPLNEAAVMLVRCKKLKLPYNHSEVVKGYRIYYNITKTVRMRGRDYHTLLMGNPTKKELVRYATLIGGVRLKRDMKKDQMKRVILKALSASGVTEPTAIRAVRARILRAGGKPVKPLVGETTANTVRVYITKPIPIRNNRVKSPNNNSLVMPKPLPKPGEEVKPMNISLPIAPAAAPANATRPVNVNPYDAKPVNNGRARLFGVPIPGTGPPAAPVAIVTGGGGNRGNRRGLANLKMAKNLLSGSGNTAANKRAELQFKLEMEKLKNARNAARTENERGALDRELETKKKILQFQKNVKLNQIEPVNSVVNEMRGLVGDRKLRKVGKINNVNYIIRRVEEMTAKGGLVSRGYSPNIRAKAEELLRRYRRARRGKGDLNAHNANSKITNHKKRYDSNKNYRTPTFLRLARRLNNNNNANVLDEALNAKIAGNLMNFEYAELKLQSNLIKRDKVKAATNNDSRNITMNANANANNAGGLVAKLPNNLRAKREEATKRRENMLQAIRNLKKITNAKQLDTAKENLRNRVDAGKFARATKARMRSAITRVKIAQTYAPVSENSTNNSNVRNRGRDPMQPGTNNEAGSSVQPNSTNNGNVRNREKGPMQPGTNNEAGSSGGTTAVNRNEVNRMLNALEGSVTDARDEEFISKYKQLKAILNNTNFNDLKARLTAIGLGRKRAYNGTVFNTNAVKNNSTQLRTRQVGGN